MLATGELAQVIEGFGGYAEAVARLDIKMRQLRIGRTEYYIDLIEFYRPNTGQPEGHFLRRWWEYHEDRWVEEIP